jgi:putative endonuclease
MNSKKTSIGKSKCPELVEGQTHRMAQQTIWYVYIARARTNRHYTGISPDPLKRIETHNSGKGSQMARHEGPFKLEYISLPFPNKSAARQREAQIKRWTVAKKQKLISGEWI